MLPGWQRVLEPYAQEGKVVAVGVVQEQHPDRSRLYRQWRQFDWPILVDSLNLLDFEVVPIPYALDEAGMVRLGPGSMSPQALRSFLEKDYPRTTVSPERNRETRPQLDGLRRRAVRENSARAWRDLGDEVFLRASDRREDETVAAYQKAVILDPSDARAHFRLGVALRRRHESPGRKPGDGQAAVASWTTALTQNPNQYIWRRRLQQYGPRLAKPYNFYFWIEQARREIRERGEEPVLLAVEPIGSEIRGRPQGDPADATVTAPNPDPEAKIQRDRGEQIRIEPVVTPARVRPGAAVRVRVELLPHRGLWNNEADETKIALEIPDDLEIREGDFVHPNPPQPETDETRVLEFELVVGPERKPGPLVLPAYALYNVCETKGGVCRYLRQDFEVTLAVSAGAPLLDDRARRRQRGHR